MEAPKVPDAPLSVRLGLWYAENKVLAIVLLVLIILLVLGLIFALVWFLVIVPKRNADQASATTVAKPAGTTAHQRFNGIDDYSSLYHQTVNPSQLHLRSFNHV